MRSDYCRLCVVIGGISACLLSHNNQGPHKFHALAAVLAQKALYTTTRTKYLIPTSTERLDNQCAAHKEGCLSQRLELFPGRAPCFLPPLAVFFLGDHIKIILDNAQKSLNYY